MFLENSVRLRCIFCFASLSFEPEGAGQLSHLRLTVPQAGDPGDEGWSWGAPAQVPDSHFRYQG